MAHDTRHSPRLSIGLPVYNGERYLAEAFDCFLAQSFQDFEIIICDNASTDRTAEICRSYAQRDPRLRYYRNEKNLGAIPNFNRVFELSRSRFFKWAAHDDLYHPRYIETCIRILDENPDVILAHSKTAFVDDRGAPFPVDPATGERVLVPPPTIHKLDPILASAAMALSSLSVITNALRLRSVRLDF